MVLRYKLVLVCRLGVLKLPMRPIDAFFYTVFLWYKSCDTR